MYRIERMKFTILKTAIMVNSIAANGVRIFLLIFCFPFMLKIKSAATGVAAPQNGTDQNLAFDNAGHFDQRFIAKLAFFIDTQFHDLGAALGEGVPTEEARVF